MNKAGIKEQIKRATSIRQAMMLAAKAQTFELASGGTRRKWVKEMERTLDRIAKECV